jgi:hypothetical protein
MKRGKSTALGAAELELQSTGSDAGGGGGPADREEPGNGSADSGYEPRAGLLVISPVEAKLTLSDDEYASWKDKVEADLAKLQPKMAELMAIASDYGGKADKKFVAFTFETIDTTFEIPKPKKRMDRREVEKIVKLLRKVMATGNETLDAEVVAWEAWKGSIVLLISAPQANLSILYSKLLSVKHGNGLALSDHMPQGSAGAGRRYRVTAMDPVFLWTIKDPATNAAMQTLLNAELAAHNTDGAWFTIELIKDAAAAASAGVVSPRTAIRCLGKYRAAHSSPKVAELTKLLTVSHVCDTIALVDDGLLVAEVAAMSPNAPGNPLDSCDDHYHRDAVSGLVNGGGGAVDDAPPGVGVGSGEADPPPLSVPPFIFGLVVPTSGGGTACIKISTDGGGRLHGATVDAALNQLDPTRPNALHNKERGRRRVVGLCRPPFGKGVHPWKSSRSNISWPHPCKGGTPVLTSDFVYMEVTAGSHTQPLTLEDTWRFADTTRSEAQPDRHFRLVWTCTSCNENVVQHPERQLCLDCARGCEPSDARAYSGYEPRDGLLVISPAMAEVTLSADQYASWKDQVEAGLAKLQPEIAKLKAIASDYGGKADDDFAAITLETIDTAFAIPKPTELMDRRELENIVDMLRIVMATGDEHLDAEVVQWEAWKG